MLVMVATALYVGFISPDSQASVSGALRAFGQCRVTPTTAATSARGSRRKQSTWLAAVDRTTCTASTGIETAGPAILTLGALSYDPLAAERAQPCSFLPTTPQDPPMVS
jgi:hypothetical protein